MNAITHPYPNLAKKYVGSHIPNTIQVCTAKKVSIIKPEIAKHIFATLFIDNL